MASTKRSTPIPTSNCTSTSTRGSSACSPGLRLFRNGGLSMDQLANELAALGYSVDLSRRDINVLIIRAFHISAGRDAGKVVDVGFPVADYPNSPPCCVYFTPQLDAPAQG